MSLDLTHFSNRVHAAVTTGQCLDYAQDVQDLLAEVNRYRSGWEAVEYLIWEASRKAAIGVGLDYSEMRKAGERHRVLQEVKDAFERAAR